MPSDDSYLGSFFQTEAGALRFREGETLLQNGKLDLILYVAIVRRRARPETVFFDCQRPFASKKSAIDELVAQRWLPRIIPSGGGSRVHGLPYFCAK